MSKIVGVTWHWTAGADGVNDVEKDAYNFITNRNGITVPGDFPPEAQTPANIKKGSNFYAAHTLNANSYRIGHTADAMAGARERPLYWGPAPLTEVQIREMMKFTAGLCRVYKIPVSRETTLSHAEVEPTLGIKQKQKWDITCLPGDVRVRDPIEVGDILRDMVAKELRGESRLSQVESAPPSKPLFLLGWLNLHNRQRPAQVARPTAGGEQKGWRWF